MGDLRRAEGWGGRFLGVIVPRPPEFVEAIERRKFSNSVRIQGAGGGANEVVLEVRLPALKGR